MFYAQSTGGFYDTAIHGSRKLYIIEPGWVNPQIEVQNYEFDPDESVDGPTIFVDDPSVTPPLVEVDNPDCKIPADAVEITAEEHAALLEGQSAGKVITTDADGRPVLTDPAPQTADELASAARVKRGALLAACDWTQARDIPEAVSNAWAPYRQSLRDITAQEDFPHTIAWPEAPQ